MKKLVMISAVALAGFAFAATPEEGFEPEKVMQDCRQAVLTGDAPEAFFEFCGEVELQLRDDVKANEEAVASNGLFRRLIRRNYWNSHCSYGYGASGYGHYGYTYSYKPYSSYGYGHYASHGGYGHYGYGHYGSGHYGQYGYGHHGYYHYGHHSHGGYGPYHPW